MEGHGKAVTVETLFVPDTSGYSGQYMYICAVCVNFINRFVVALNVDSVHHPEFMLFAWSS